VETEKGGLHIKQLEGNKGEEKWQIRENPVTGCKQFQKQKKKNA